MSSKRKGKLNGLTKDLLEDLYLHQKLSQTEIAKRFGVHQGAIWYWMKAYNIQARDYYDEYRKKKLSDRFSARNNPRWKGGRSRTHHGYIDVIVPEHLTKRRSKRNYIKEHIYVWEKFHKKDLPKGTEIHHLNGIKDDNRIENLLAMPSKEHRYLLAALKSEILRLQMRIEELLKEKDEKQDKQS